MKISRVLRHLVVPDWVARRPFTRAVMNRIEAAVRASEAKHAGELVVAMEAGLHLRALLRGQTPRHRAIDAFSELRVWDTEHNNGVLIYLQLADRAIEIVADRGIHARVPQHDWDAICHRMEEAFKRGEFERGVLTAIDEVTAHLARHFPPHGRKRDELPDRPVVM